MEIPTHDDSSLCIIDEYLTGSLASLFLSDAR